MTDTRPNQTGIDPSDPKADGAANAVTETPETRADGAGIGDATPAAAVLSAAGACGEGVAWAQEHRADPWTAWESCNRGHWLLWWVGRYTAATDGPGLGGRLGLVYGLGDIAAMVGGSNVVGVLRQPLSPTLLMRACRTAADSLAADLGETDAASMVARFRGITLAAAEMPTDLALDGLALCVYGAMSCTPTDLPEVCSGVAVFSGLLLPPGPPRLRWLATVADVCRVRWPDAGQWRPES